MRQSPVGEQQSWGSDEEQRSHSTCGIQKWTQTEDEAVLCFHSTYKFSQIWNGARSLKSSFFFSARVKSRAMALH